MPPRLSKIRKRLDRREKKAKGKQKFREYVFCAGRICPRRRSGPGVGGGGEANLKRGPNQAAITVRAIFMKSSAGLRAVE